MVLQGFDWSGYLLTQIVACLVSGLTGGTMAVVFYQKWLRSMSYGKALFLIFLFYSAFSLIVGFFAGGIYFSNQMGMGFFSPEVLSAAWGFLLGMESSRFFFVWLFILMGTLAVLLVNDKYGPGVFFDMLMGKYFHPRREERIFMFLDLRGSTTTAERLGEEKYFEFIKSVFADATPAILQSRGEIYQYIGDEILISWKMKSGLTQARCVDCFFEIKNKFKNDSDKYLERFGVVPDFKAGLHCGHVMVGEVGVVKRDIAFSGDVLNTAARIQGECNGLGVDILLSKFLLEKLDIPTGKFSAKQLGEMLLRGKQEKVRLFTIENN